jgi:hypothetical protein
MQMILIEKNALISNINFERENISVVITLKLMTKIYIA